MQRQNLRLAIVSDRPNQGIAKTYFSMLHKKGDSAYAASQWSMVEFNPAHPELATEGLEKQHAALARIGVPGRGDYTDALYGFLEAFMSVRRKPVLGLITHDAPHTRYIIERWPDTRRLPDGAVSILDASRSLSLKQSALESALHVLLRNRPGFSPEPPFTDVRSQGIVSLNERELIREI